MSKFLIVLVSILSIVLACVIGYYMVELVKFMGANMLTIKGVFGCYAFGILVSFVLWAVAVVNIKDKVK